MERGKPLRSKVKELADLARIQGSALNIVYKDRRTPWFAKFVAALVVIQVFNPIDILPDFIPVVGYLDDLILIPAGIWLVWKLVPSEVRNDALDEAKKHVDTHPDLPRIYKFVFIAGAVLFIAALIWVILQVFKPAKSG